MPRHHNSRFLSFKALKAHYITDFTCQNREVLRARGRYFWPFLPLEAGVGSLEPPRAWLQDAAESYDARAKTSARQSSENQRWLQKSLHNEDSSIEKGFSSIAKYLEESTWNAEELFHDLLSCWFGNFKWLLPGIYLKLIPLIILVIQGGNRSKQNQRGGYQLWATRSCIYGTK